MDAEKVLQKEEFVSNNTGTSLKEVFACVTVAVLCCALSAILRHGLRKKRVANSLHFVMDNFLIITPCLLSLTLFADHLAAVIIVLASLLALMQRRHVTSVSVFVQACKEAALLDTHCIKNYKTTLQISTAMCILAVDFHVFPRRFAKAEVYGIGLMDTAVGAIVFSTALTSSAARETHVTFERLVSSFKNSILLLLLGILRVALVKNTNYQEHVTEYGVHWNFFITLAIVRLLATFVLFVFPFIQRQFFYLILSLILIVGYQVLLTYYGLTLLIQEGFDTNRVSFLDANREGIFSCIGYLAIYFAGLFFGRQMFKQRQSLQNKAGWLAFWFLVGAMSTNTLRFFSFPISRKMANASYFAFQIAFNAYILLGFQLVDIMCVALTDLSRKAEDKNYAYEAPLISRAINKYLLPYFLLANVMTGMVNFSIDTLAQSRINGVLIVYTYILFLNGIFCWIYIYTF